MERFLPVLESIYDNAVSFESVGACPLGQCLSRDIAFAPSVGRGSFDVVNDKCGSLFGSALDR